MTAILIFALAAIALWAIPELIAKSAAGYYEPEAISVESIERLDGGGIRVHFVAGPDSVLKCVEVELLPSSDPSRAVARFRREWYENPAPAVGSFEVRGPVAVTALEIRGESGAPHIVPLDTLPSIGWRREDARRSRENASAGE